MTKPAFRTAIEDDGQILKGPWRRPHQMLNAQVYDSHASIHDNATAQKLGFKGGTIEGPTHFSQFSPLCEHLFGQEWFEAGCISAHYRNAVYEGEGYRPSSESHQRVRAEARLRCSSAMGRKCFAAACRLDRMLKHPLWT